MKEYDYPSVICEYCSWTEYGELPCGQITPNGYISCEGCNCEQALDLYNDSNENELTMEGAF